MVPLKAATYLLPLAMQSETSHFADHRPGRVTFHTVNHCQMQTQLANQSASGLHSCRNTTKDVQATKLHGLAC